jgi:hypothetical protein
MDLCRTFEPTLLLEFFANYLRSLTAFPSKATPPQAIATRLTSATHLISSFYSPLSELLLNHEDSSEHTSFHQMLQLLMACIFLAPSSDLSSSLPLVQESSLQQLVASFYETLTRLTGLGQILRNESQICDWIVSLSHALT